MGWIPRFTTAAVTGSTTFLKFCRSGADIKTIIEADSRTVHLSIGSSSTVDMSTGVVELAKHLKGEVKDGLVRKMLVCAGAAAAVGGVSYLVWRKYGRSITRRLFQDEDDVEADRVMENNGVDDVNHDDVRDEDSEYSDGDDDDDDDDDDESDTSYPDLETYVYGSWGRGDAAKMFSDEEIDVPAMPATQRRVQRSRKRLVRAGRSRDYTY